jgi:hypothetical protein
MSGMDRLIDHGVIAWGMSRKALAGKNRCIAFARPRQVLMWFAVKRYGFSLSETARAMNRDHTTILHGVQKVDALLEIDTDTAELWMAFNDGRPNVDTVRRPAYACAATNVPIVSFAFSHTGWETPPEDMPEGIEIPIESVIDEAAMMRRRMAGRA